MAVVAAEMSLKKALVMADGNSNGSRVGLTTISSGVRHSIFPRVTRAEREAGKTRYRKIFLKNDNNSLESAYGALAYLTFPSPAGDRFYIAAGTQTDTEADITGTPPDWLGCGQLKTSISAGAGSVVITMENNDFEFPAGALLHISSNYKTGQTIGAGVTPGASVTNSGGTWGSGNHNGDTVYPNGIYLGNNTVLTDDGTGHEEWLEIHGSTAATWSGNDVTVTLAGTTSYAYTNSVTWVGCCIGNSDIVATVDTYGKTSPSGTYDDTNYPVVPDNKGSVEETITVTFSSSSAYTASGSVSGALGSGTTSGSFAPVNPDSSTPYFTIPAGFFTGTWANGNTCTFKTHPAALAIWLKEVVPAGTAANANNLFTVGYYWE